jgi:hypothetical protein
MFGDAEAMSVESRGLALSRRGLGTARVPNRQTAARVNVLAFARENFRARRDGRAPWFDFRAPGCESVRAATLGELWNELAIGIVSRFCARET